MISKFFGAAQRDFHFGIEEALLWERERRKSLYQAFKELSSGTFYMKDVQEILRIGLIGGGLDEVEAFTLVEGYLGHMKFEKAVELALAVIEDAYFEKKAAIEE